MHDSLCSCHSESSRFTNSCMSDRSRFTQYDNHSASTSTSGGSNAKTFRTFQPLKSRPQTKMNIVVPEIEGGQRKTDMNVLVASVGCNEPLIVQRFLPSLIRLPDVSVRAVLDTSFRAQDFINASTTCLASPNVSRQSASKDITNIEQEAAEACEWADVLVLAPLDAFHLAKMLHGETDDLLLEILRGWNVSKKILMVPGMSASMWENPMTKKQLSKIRRKWNWVRVFQPILWTFEQDIRKIISWSVLDEVRLAVRNQVDLMTIGKGMDVSPHESSMLSGVQAKNRLPPELWTMILDFAGDWELAQNLHIYSNLSPPSEWSSHTAPHGPRNYMEALELTILRGSLSDVRHFIATNGVPRWLSKLCIRLIMRFAMVPLLAELERSHKDLFWATFGHTFLPDKASSVFGRTEILEFWRTSPSFLTKSYNVETLDGASKFGFLDVLEWWQRAGLPLKFTEASMEQASAQGHLRVLEWWKTQAIASEISNSKDKLRLKPGKSIVYATQNGRTEIVKWWIQSGIAFPHEDTVAKLASTHGHVEILRLWHNVKGNKMIFDNQVLVGATKMGNVNVLEWWKSSGLKVEYKTCDIEEALEDGLEGVKGDAVRRWWARNGLNLGVGTSEWMKTKFLNS